MVPIVRRSPARLVASIVALCASAAGLAVIQAAPASAACAAGSSHYLKGTLAGQDHRDINAQISLDIKDRYNNTIDLNGCKTSAYSKTIWMNMKVSGSGVVHSARTTNTWQVSNLPANAVSAWIEVYTRTSLGAKCPTCDGAINTIKYGFINRRAVPLNHSYTLTAPMSCPYGGSSGTIQGAVTAGGRAIKLDRIYAWSELTPDGSKPLQGWGQGMQGRTGYYKIDNLASGQTYVVRATYHGKTQERRHVAVGSCKNVPLRFVF